MAHKLCSSAHLLAFFVDQTCPSPAVRASPDPWSPSHGKRLHLLLAVCCPSAVWAAAHCLLRVKSQVELHTGCAPLGDDVGQCLSLRWAASAQGPLSARFSAVTAFSLTQRPVLCYYYNCVSLSSLYKRGNWSLESVSSLPKFTSL